MHTRVKPAKDNGECVEEEYSGPHIESSLRNRHLGKHVLDDMCCVLYKGFGGCDWRRVYGCRGGVEPVQNSVKEQRKRDAVG